MIFHVDMNSFYASCERLFRPDLDAKPIIVLSNNDGIIIALNQEAKNLGLKRGDAYFQVKAFCAIHNVFVFSSNYTLYADICTRLNSLYSSYAPEIEVYSIDESFLYFPDWENAGFVEMGLFLKEKVWNELHIPIAVGIAPTKTLAKMCNKLAKKRNGVCFWNDLDQKEELQNILVGDIWGIGRAKERVLSRLGVFTAYDLQNLSLEKAKKQLTITGMKTVQELNAVQAIDYELREKRKKMTTSKSFAYPVTSLMELEVALCEYCQISVTKLREEKQACSHISVYLMTARQFDENQKHKEYFNALSYQFAKKTSFLPEILSVAKSLLKRMYREGYEYRKVMVCLMKLSEAGEAQEELFDFSDYENSLKGSHSITNTQKEALMAVCDEINMRYGKLCLHPGLRNAVKDKTSEGKAVSWKMKRNMLSPHYTTRLEEVPIVKG